MVVESDWAYPGSKKTFLAGALQWPRHLNKVVLFCRATNTIEKVPQLSYLLHYTHKPIHWANRQRYKTPSSGGVTGYYVLCSDIGNWPRVKCNWTCIKTYYTDLRIRMDDRKRNRIESRSVGWNLWVSGQSAAKPLSYWGSWQSLDGVCQPLASVY